MKLERHDASSPRDPASRRWVAFARAATLGGSLFCLTFYPTNWLATRSASRWSTGLAWEQHIPYEPVWFLAYGSAFLLVALVPLCVDHVQTIRAWGKKFSLAILCATPFFLVLPTQTTFSLTDLHTSSLPIDLIRTVTGQYNCFPSLHATLSWLTVRTVAEAGQPCHRLIWWSWFALIALSTLLTHQHHIADVLTGIFLGWLVDRMSGKGTEPPVSAGGNAT